jgi:hypothetical protein
VHVLVGHGTAMASAQEKCAPDERLLDWLVNEVLTPTWERYYIARRSAGAADALQLSLVCFSAFENHFCSHE